MFRPRHVPLFPFLASCAVALTLAISVPVQAASSYFMVQGPLAPGGAYETYKFRVEYTGVLTIPGYQPAPPGTPEPLVNSGEALLVSVFGNGVTVPSGTYTNSVGSAVAPSGFLSGFQISGGSLTFSGAYPTGPQWGYFASGGTYVNNFVDPVINGIYDPGIWTESKTGMGTRYLTDGSFDAWSYGLMTDTGQDDEWGFDIFAFAPPVGVTPTLGDFSGPLYAETKVSADGLPYTVYRIMAVPEPGRMIFLLLGASVVFTRRSRNVRI